MGDTTPLYPRTGRTARVASRRINAYYNLSNRAVAFCAAAVEKCLRKRSGRGSFRHGVELFWQTSWMTAVWTMGLNEVTLDQCAFGAPWRKTLRIWHSGVELQHLGRRCEPQKSICQFTGRKHLQIQGRHPSGVQRASLANEMPRSLRQAIARAYVTHFQNLLLCHKWRALARVRPIGEAA